MNSGLIVTRYAKALLTSSEEQGVSVNIYKLMSTLVDSFAQHNTLQSVLKNPTLSIAQKKELITVASIPIWSPVTRSTPSPNPLRPRKMLPPPITMPT